MEKKIRIAHVTQAMGGVKTHIKYILDHADPARFSFEIIAPADNDFMEFARQRNIPYHIVPFTRNIHPLKDLRSFIALFGMIRKNRFDIVHLHSAKAGIIGRVICALQRQCSVFTPNGFSYLGAKGFKRTVFFSIETMFKNTATKLFAVSHCEANRAIHELGTSPEKVVVVQNAIIPFDNPVGIGNQPIKIISTIGRLTAQKNLIQFVEVARLVLQHYPDMQFRILGAGYHDDQKEEILDKIKKYGLEARIHIIPWSHQISIEQYLAESDVYISTSIFEGLPYSILEAMSLGVPCVASFCDGNNDIITPNKDGFLCNTVNQFVAAIIQLQEDAVLRMAISKQAIETIRQRYDIGKRGTFLSEEYLKLLNQ